MQPFHRSFGPHLGYTRHIVHGVTHQGLVVQHQVRRHAKFFLHSGQVAAFSVHGVDDGDVRIDQLRQVFVAAAHNHFNALVSGSYCQRTNHVIGFHARYIQYRPAQQTHDLVDRRNLAAQVIRHRRAIGFVIGVNSVPKRRAFGVKHASHVVCRYFFAQALHHVDHDADRTGLLHRTVGQRGAHGIATGKKGTVEVAGAVHQQQSFLDFGHGGHFALRFWSLQRQVSPSGSRTN